MGNLNNPKLTFHKNITYVLRLFASFKNIYRKLKIISFEKNNNNNNNNRAQIHYLYLARLTLKVNVLNI